MTITLYSNKSEKGKIGKTLEEIGNVLNGTLKEDTSITDPVIKVKRYNNIYSANYLYIPQFSRYYFITDVKAITGGMYEISCHVDVLESFKTAILENYAYIERAEKGNLYYSDNGIPVSVDSHVIIKNFNGEPFSHTSIVMPLSSAHVA